MYRVECDGVVIHDQKSPDIDIHLISPTLKLEENAAGSFEFTITKNNPGYESIDLMKSQIFVKRDNEIIWIGRPLSSSTDFYHRKKVLCEGCLAYLNDTVNLNQKLFDINDSGKEIFRKVIDQHNNNTGDTRRTFGNSADRQYASLANLDGWSQNQNNKTSWDIIKDVFVDNCEGYIKIEYPQSEEYASISEYNVHPRISYLFDRETCTQGINFGENLLDFTKDYDMTKLCTVIYPKGKDITEQDEDGNTPEIRTYARIGSVNNNKDYIENAEGVAKYGRIAKEVEFNDIDIPATLKVMAQRYLNTLQFDDMVLTISALDLHYLNPDIDHLNLSEEVHCFSAVHGLDAFFPVTEISIPLDNPDQIKYTLNTTVSKGITNQYATNNMNTATNSTVASTEQRINNVEKDASKVHTVSKTEIKDATTYTSELKANNVTVEKLTATEAYISTLKSNNIEASNLTADHATINQLVTTSADITNLHAAAAYIGDLTAENVTSTNLITTNAKVSALTAGDITVNDIRAAAIYTEDLDSRNVTAADIQASKATINSLIANGVSVETLRAASAYITVLEAGNLQANSLLTDTANIESLVAGDVTVNSLRAASGYISELSSDSITASDISSATGYIADLITRNVTASEIAADKAVINSLIANDVTVNSLRAASAYIASLESEEIDVDDISAATAYIASLEADSIEAAKVIAAAAYINTLISNEITASNIQADHAQIATIVSDYLTASDMQAEVARVGTLLNGYMQTNLANANVAWIQNGNIKDGSITNAMINSVSANKLTAGTIDASNITVTNLNADNITTGTINGQRIGTGSLSLDKLEDDVYTETEVDNLLSNMQTQIDGAIETWTGTAVPTLSNTPASSWTTNAIKDTHIGDVYFVVNSNSQQNGYNYRFTKSGNTYSWQLIKDSDVTNALSRLTTAEGKIGTIEQFDSDISSWKTSTDEEISSIKSNHTTLVGRVETAEGTLSTKVDTTTFNTLSQTVDSNSSSITSLTTKTESLEILGGATNLSPFYSWKFNDAYNATTNPTGYWKDVPTSLVTRLTNGWAHISIDNEAGASSNYMRELVRPKSIALSDLPTTATLLLEIKNFTSNFDGSTDTTLHCYFQANTSPQGQLKSKNTSSIRLYQNDSYLIEMNRGTTTSSYFVDCSFGVYGGYSASFDARLSIYDGLYDGPYKPYVYQDTVVDISTVTNRISDVSQTLDGVTTRVGSVEQTVATKADGSTVETINNNLTSLTTTVDGHTTSINNLTSTVETKADSSTVATLQGTVNTISDTVDGHTSSINSINNTTASISSIAVKSTTRLYRICSSTTAPSAPTSHITNSSSSATNVWTTSVPSYNASYPYYFYCYEYQYVDNSYGWSSVVRDLATEETQSTSRTALTNANNAQTTANKNVKESIQLWYTTSSTSAPAKPTSVVTSSSNLYGGWRTVVPIYDASYPNYYYCWQYKLADNTYSWSSVVYDYATSEAQATARKNVKETIQLWCTVSSTDNAPSKPTSAVTSTSTNGNSWRVVVPTYSSSYPYYYYCWQYKLADGTYDWSDVVYDRATTETQSTARTASTNASTAQTTAEAAQTTANSAQTIANKNVKEAIQLWYTNSTNTAPSKPTSSVTSTSTSGGAWRTVVPTYSSSYPYYYYCMQYKLADGTYSWSNVVYDKATTEAQDVSRTVTSNLATLQNDYADFKQTTTTFESTIGSTYATKEEMHGLQFGARNLLRNTGNPIADNVYMVRATIQNDKSFRLTPTTYTAVVKWKVNYLNYTDYNNDQYTFSLEARLADASSNYSSSNINLYIGFNASDKINEAFSSSYDRYAQSTINDISSSWTKYSITVGCPNDLILGTNSALVDGSNLTVEVVVSGSRKPLDIRNFKLEKGNKYTDWTPAPEDLALGADLVSLESRVSTNETSIQQTNSAISLKANSSDVYTKSQTYTKDETDSQIDSDISTEVTNRNLAIDTAITTEIANRNAAIQVASDSITSTVAATYSTKTELANLKVGGTNLIIFDTTVLGRIDTDGNLYTTSNGLYHRTTQAIPVVTGDSYILTWYEVENGSYSTSYLYISWFDSNGAIISREAVPNHNTGASGSNFTNIHNIQPDSMKVTVPDNAVTARISIPNVLVFDKQVQFEHGGIATDLSLNLADQGTKPNLLRGTNQNSTLYTDGSVGYWSNGSWYIGSGGTGSGELISISDCPDSNQKWGFRIYATSGAKTVSQQGISFKANVAYRFTCYVRLTPNVEQSSSAIEFRMYASSGINSNYMSVTSNEWVLYTRLFALSDSDIEQSSLRPLVGIKDGYPGSIDICALRLTEGVNIWPWSVALEDYPSYNEYNNRFISAETSISQNSDAIELRATKSEVSAMETRLSNAETTISQNTEAITLRATKTEAYQTAQPNLSPYFSSEFGDTTYWYASSHPKTSSELGVCGTQLSDGWMSVQMDNSARSSAAYMNMWIKPQSWVKNSQKYTFLVEVRDLTFTAGSSIEVRPAQNETTTQTGSVASSDFTGDRDAYIYTTTKSDAITGNYTTFGCGYFKVDAGTNVTFSVRISIYEGEYTGPYKPYSGIQVFASQAELKVANDAISTKVSSNGVISAINQSAESIQIQASKVAIDGTAIFNAVSTSVDNAITAKGYQTATQVSTAISTNNISKRNLLPCCQSIRYLVGPITNAGVTISYDGSGWFKVSGTITTNANTSITLWRNEAGDYASPINDLIQQGTTSETISMVVETEGTPFVYVENSATQGNQYLYATHIVCYGTSSSSSTRLGGHESLTVTKTLSQYFSKINYYIAKYTNGSVVNGRFRIMMVKGSTQSPWYPALEDSTSNSRDLATNRQQTIYISKADGTTSVNSNTTWVIDTAQTLGAQNTWTTKRPVYDASYPVVFVATQSQTVAQQSTDYGVAGTTCSCTVPVIDDTTTIIDGGRIITGSVTANKLNASSINASNILTVGSLTQETQDAILNSNVDIDAVNRNLLKGSSDWNSNSWYTTGSNTSISGDTFIFSEVSTVSWRSIGYRKVLKSSELEYENLVLSFEYYSDDFSDATNDAYVYVNIEASDSADSSRTQYYKFSESTEIIPTSTWQTASIAFMYRPTMFTSGSGNVNYIGITFFNHTNKGYQIRHPKLERGVVATEWCLAIEDTACKSDATNRTQRLWRRETTNTTPSAPSAWIETSGTGYSSWSTSAPQLTSGNTKYPYLFTCVQTQTIAQMEGGSLACSNSPVVIDDSMTVIDGGNIITGSITANKIDTSELHIGYSNVDNAPDISSAISTATEAVKNEVILGGRNLIRKSDRFESSDWTHSGTQVSQPGELLINYNNNTGSVRQAKLKVDYLDYATYGAGDYTVSWEAMEDLDLASGTSLKSGQYLRVYLGYSASSAVDTMFANNSSHKYVYKGGNLTSEWKRYSSTFTVPDDFTTGSLTLASGCKMSLVFYRAKGYVPVRVRRIKIERGSQATPWTAAPEDLNLVNSSISTLTGSISDLVDDVSDLDTDSTEFKLINNTQVEVYIQSVSWAAGTATLSVRCRRNGTAVTPTGYQWYNSSGAISGATSSTLSIGPGNTATSLEDVYSCLVTFT